MCSRITQAYNSWDVNSLDGLKERYALLIHPMVLNCNKTLFTFSNFYDASYVGERLKEIEAAIETGDKQWSSQKMRELYLYFACQRIEKRLVEANKIAKSDRAHTYISFCSDRPDIAHTTEFFDSNHYKLFILRFKRSAPSYGVSAYETEMYRGNEADAKRKYEILRKLTADQNYHRLFFNSEFDFQAISKDKNSPKYREYYFGAYKHEFAISPEVALKYVEMIDL